MTDFAQASGAHVDAPAAEDSGFEDTHVPLTAEQACAWRATHRPLPLATPVLAQALVALLAVVVTAWLPLEHSVAQAWSVAWGALAAWLPALVFARAAARQRRKAHGATAALSSLMLWEGVKVVLTVALLLVAPRVLGQVHWLALLVGFVLTIKIGWFVLWVLSTRRVGG